MLGPDIVRPKQKPINIWHCERFLDLDFSHFNFRKRNHHQFFLYLLFPALRSSDSNFKIILSFLMHPVLLSAPRCLQTSKCFHFRHKYMFVYWNNVLLLGGILSGSLSPTKMLNQTTLWLKMHGMHKWICRLLATSHRREPANEWNKMKWNKAWIVTATTHSSTEATKMTNFYKWSNHVNDSLSMCSNGNTVKRQRNDRNAPKDQNTKTEPKKKRENWILIR